MPKNAQTSALVLMPHNRKAMLKVLQDKLQQYMGSEHPDGQTGFRKSRGTKDQITNIFWIIKKAREFHKKHLLLLHWLCLWLCGSQKTVDNSSRDGNIRTPDLPPEKPVCSPRSNSQIQTWNNRLVPNRERKTSRLYIVNLLIQLICRVHHEKCWAKWSTSWNQDCLEKYQY